MPEPSQNHPHAPIRSSQPFAPGWTRITISPSNPNQPPALPSAWDLKSSGLGVSVLRLSEEQSQRVTLPTESAWLLMNGRCTVEFGDRQESVQRNSLFDERPTCVHLSADSPIRIAATTASEWTVYTTENPAPFDPEFFSPEDVRHEPRGRGQVADASHRFVRTIFDDENAAPQSQLVLGEAVNFPGRWSSYPPHHHPQPEIYHYRFTDPRGYGHAEVGEAVFKVRSGDTLVIPPGHDHAQCAAPGYGMYYAWVIRHLPHQRYTVPEFTPEHDWTRDPTATFWWPKDA